jgi:hypothetical protein
MREVLRMKIRINMAAGIFPERPDRQGLGKYTGKIGKLSGQDRENTPLP